MKTSHLELRSESLPDGILVKAHAHGTLDGGDYDELIPELNRLLADGTRVNFLLFLENFHGWDSESFTRELQWDATHRRGIGRVAVVGSEEWEKWAVRLARGIVPGEVRYFNQAKAAEARAWVEKSAEDSAV